MDDTTDRPSGSLRGFVILLIAAMALFIFYAYVVWSAFAHDWKESGVFGDSFGGLNALFSGSALAGVIFSILLQRDELRLQREELRMTRTELQRTAAAQEKSEHALQEQVEMLRLTARLNSINILIGIYTTRIDESRRNPGAAEAREEKMKLALLTSELESLLAAAQVDRASGGRA